MVKHDISIYYLCRINVYVCEVALMNIYLYYALKFNYFCVRWIEKAYKKFNNVSGIIEVVLWLIGIAVVMWYCYYMIILL